MEKLTIVMPVYNEEEGLPEFLAEILEHVRPLAREIEIVVVDDRSTDRTAKAVGALDFKEVRVVTQSNNRGHGPTALVAYKLGLESKPDVLVHVDGDGQFLGVDFPRLISALSDPAVDVVHGVRQKRSDPWFRRLITIVLGVVASTAVRRPLPDLNTPLRAYRPLVVKDLLREVPVNATVPHVHFSLAEARGGYGVRYVKVRSIPRRGSRKGGTMWGEKREHPRLPPKKLLLFVVGALREVWRVSLRSDAPMRAIRRPT